MIAVIDYDAGNMKSVEKAFQYLGEDVCITRDRKKIMSADKVVLPGVGAFGDAMERLKKYDLVETIKGAVSDGKPFLGICLGLQLLFDRSDEAPGVEGLGILLKIPHMGWNNVKLMKESRIFHDLGENPYFYFVHSYYLKADKPEDVAAVTYYGTKIDAAVEHENVFASQFHPEKSSRTGLRILRNFAQL